jgi:uncharacterized protein YhaN
MADLSARLDLTYVPETRAMLAAIRAQREKLTDQRSRDTRRRTYAQQAEQAAVTLATLARALANRQSELQDVITACGADSLDAALQRLAAAAARAAHQATLDSNHAKLMADGDGLTLAALRAEADAVAADDVPAALAAARAEAEAAQEQAQADSGALALQRQKLEQLGRDTAYAEAMEAQQAATATADRLLREALTARLAAALLGRALEAVEQAGGADMLARIGGWFALLTGGAYRALVSEPTDDKRQMLLAVPADRPEELKYVHQLSEGTRDQLYLALRLEAVAAHADPLPFIADDILQTFDDARALAALHTLQKLSETVQVIVLTHHGHIAELAARLPVGCFKISTLS